FMQWHTAKVQSLEDAKRMETSLAGTGPGSIAETVPRLLNAVIGTKFKLVSGYPASSEAMLAMERGEVDGASSSWAAVKVGKQAWLRENKIRIILQTAPERIAELPHAPSLGEIGDTLEDKQLFAPLRERQRDRALAACSSRSSCRADASLPRSLSGHDARPGFYHRHPKAERGGEPLSGDELEELVRRALTIPAAVRERAKLAFGR